MSSRKTYSSLAGTAKMSRPAGQWFSLSVRYLRMDAMCLKARCAERHKWLICWSIDRVLFKNTPRFLHVDSTKCFFNLSG